VKAEWKLCLGAGLFLGATAIVYWFWSKEDTGTVCLVFGAVAYTMIFGYLFYQGRKQGGVRPEDNPDGTSADGAGPVDFFPSSSMWPFGIGVGMVTATLGFIFGTWYLVIGLLVTVGGIIAFATEAEARR
jgi:hypothetical protein